MSTYKPDRRGIAEMLKGVELQHHLRERAERIAEAARSTAPVGPTDGLTADQVAHYKDSFEVSSGVLYRGLGDSRAYARIENDSDHAAAVEFGNFRTRKQTIQAQHVLGRAIDAAKG